MSHNLIWIDIETTGLNASEDSILEVAVVATDSTLKELAFKEVVVRQDDNTLSRMCDRVLQMHVKTGLVDKVLSEDSLPSDEAETLLCQWMEVYNVPSRSAMCGSSVHFDRAFLKVDMPRLEGMFHYRNFDSTSLLIARGLFPKRFGSVSQMRGTKHNALDDIRQSIALARGLLA